MPHVTDLNLTPKDISDLTSADAMAALLAGLGYDVCPPVIGHMTLKEEFIEAESTPLDAGG